jgi:uncharacterized membrane protein
MGMWNKIVYLIVLLILSQIASAATIHGTVYDLYLSKQDDVVVNINSNPIQTFVAKNGTYSFEITNGNYNITAKYSEGGILKSEATESILIKQNGDYNVDLILFPVLEPETVEDINFNDSYFNKGISIVEIIIFIIALIGFGVIIYFLFRSRKMLKEVAEEVKKSSENTSDLAREVLDFIKSQEGRTTQKDIRKNFPSSEAKISLVISELEDKGIVKRIKKGRGNIIVLR